LTTLKVLAEGKVRKGDRPAERNLSANLRANGQKQHSKAEPQGESAQHDEAHLDHCGSVNAVVVHRKIMLLSGEICPTLRPPRVVALYVVVHEAIEQKSADGIVVDSYLMMRRPEAKRGDHPLSSVLSRGRVIRSSSPRLVAASQQRYQASPEIAGKRSDWKQIGALRRMPLIVCTECAAGHKTVHMNMLAQVLAPGVQHRCHAQLTV
jgi:hypothetical protein